MQFIINLHSLNLPSRYTLLPSFGLVIFEIQKLRYALEYIHTTDNWFQKTINHNVYGDNIIYTHIFIYNTVGCKKLCFKYPEHSHNPIHINVQWL